MTTTADTGEENAIRPTEVHDILKKSILVDGFHLVADLEKSHGSYLVDARDGREYLDFYTYFATLPVGHNHPRLLDSAFQEELLRATTANPANSDVYTVEFAEFVQTFRRSCQKDLPHAFFVAGGALAVENALKAAFDWKVRKNIAAGRSKDLGTQVIHFRDAFHGRSGYTLSLTNTDPTKTKYFPKFDWPRVTNPRCLFPLKGENLDRVQEAETQAVAEIEQAVKESGHDIAALIIEPIQCEGGDIHFRPRFLQELRRLADEHEFMLVFDEVQTGVGVTGRFWAYEHFGVVPDAVSFGKKMQVCGFIGSKRFDEVEGNVFAKSSRINSTWGGNLADMVRARKILEIIEEENLIQNAEERGKTLLAGIQNLESRHEAVSQARGLGLIAAFDLPSPEMRNKALAKARDHGVLGLPCGPQSIRFRPTLTVTDEEIEKGVEILDRAIKDLA